MAPKGLTPDGRVLASQGRRVLAYLNGYGIWMVPNAIIGVLPVATFVSALSESDDLSELNVPVVVGQLFGFGYWWAFFDDRNRALHDLVCAVVVIDER